MDEKLDEDTMTADKCSEAMLRYARANPSLKVMSEMQLVSEFKDELQSGPVNEIIQDYVSHSKDISGVSNAVPDGQKGPKDNCNIKKENVDFETMNTLKSRLK